MSILTEGISFFFAKTEAKRIFFAQKESLKKYLKRT